MKKTGFGILAVALTAGLVACGGGSGGKGGQSAKKIAPHYFLGGTNAAERQLWRTDGTADGTVAMTHIPGVVGSLAAGVVSAAGKVFFLASDGVDAGALWVVDASPVGAKKLLGDSLNGVTNIARLTPLGRLVYFTATTNASGEELWRSDGTEQGTYQVADLAAGACGGYPSSLTAFKERLYFAGVSSCTGRPGLWMTDGTEAGTRAVPELAPAGGSYPANMTAFNGALYLSARMNGESSLWRTDGTAAGTARVKAIRSDGGQASFGEFAVAGNQLFFRADDGEHGLELWKSDGTDEGTFMVRDINPDGNAVPSYLTAVGNEIFFAARDGNRESSLWRSNGSASGTTQVLDMDDSIIWRPTVLTAYEGGLAFRGWWENDEYLWLLPEGAGFAEVVTDGPTMAHVDRHFPVVGNTLLFMGYDEQHGREWWRLSGMTDKAQRVADICPGVCDGVHYIEN